MSRIIKVSCTNVQQHCCHENIFSEDDLMSGLPLGDDEGNIVDPHPKVVIDENTFIRCEKCGHPIRCHEATIIKDEVFE